MTKLNGNDLGKIILVSPNNSKKRWLKCLHFVSTQIKPTSTGTIPVEPDGFGIPLCAAKFSELPRVDNWCLNDVMEGVAVSRMAGGVGAA